MHLGARAWTNWLQKLHAVSEIHVNKLSTFLIFWRFFITLCCAPCGRGQSRGLKSFHMSVETLHILCDALLWRQFFHLRRTNVTTVRHHHWTNVTGGGTAEVRKLVAQPVACEKRELRVHWVRASAKQLDVVSGKQKDERAFLTAVREQRAILFFSVICPETNLRETCRNINFWIVLLKHTHAQ